MRLQQRIRRSSTNFLDRLQGCDQKGIMNNNMGPSRQLRGHGIRDNAGSVLYRDPVARIAEDRSEHNFRWDGYYGS